MSEVEGRNESVERTLSERLASRRGVETHRPFALIVATIALLLACTVPAAAATTVPLVMLGDGHFGIMVSVGGRAPQLFAIDTGAEMTYAPASLVSALALKPVGTFSFLSFSGKGFEVPMYSLPPLRGGEVTLPGSLAEDWEGLDRFAVPPLLSLWSFMDGPVTVDLANRTLTFEDPQSFGERTRNAHRVPLAVARDRDRSLLVFAMLDLGNGQRGQCLIDTGSGGMMIDARYMPLLGFKPGDTRVVAQRTDQPEGPRTHYNATLPKISLSEAPSMLLSNAGVGFVDQPIYDCEIGNDFWADKAVTFDLAHEQMFVAPGLSPRSAASVVRGASAALASRVSLSAFAAFFDSGASRLRSE